MTRLDRGMHADIRSLLRTVRKNFKGRNALADLSENAAEISESKTEIT